MTTASPSDRVTTPPAGPGTLSAAATPSGAAPAGPGLLELVVHSMTMASERVLLVELRDPSGAELPAFDAGSHVDLHVGGMIRQYSLVNDNAERHRWLLGVLRQDDGRGGSAHVHDVLRVGGHVRVSAPRTMFRLEPAGGPVTLLAGGIGVTPLAAMAERLHRDRADFTLHHYARSAAARPLSEHLAGRPWADRVVAHHGDEGDSFRNDPDVPGAWTDGATLYLCGPAGFIEAGMERALAAGWPDDAVRAERFAAALKPTGPGAAGSGSGGLGGAANGPDPDGPFDVVAASTGERMRVEAGETIAEVLQRHGHHVELSCEMGICGSCLTGVLAGAPDHRDEVQTAAEHASNSMINVCCSRARCAELTLDI